MRVFYPYWFVRKIYIWIMLSCVSNNIHNKVSGLIINSQTESNQLTDRKCRIALQEAAKIGLAFNQDYELPIKYQTAASFSEQTGTWTDSHQPLVAPTTEDVPTNLPSLCHWSNNQMGASLETCCSVEMEEALLEKTMQQMKTSLADYLNPWIDEILDFRNSLRDQLFHIFETSRDSLNRSLCGAPTAQQRPPDLSRLSACWEISKDLFSKYRLTVEQFIIGPGDIAMDISMPIDNLLMQLLIDISCPPQSQSATVTLEEFNQEIRCHKFCQSRLNLVLDSVMMNGFLDQSTPPSSTKPTTESVSPKKVVNPSSGDKVDVYRQLYSPELLFSIRLNRILVQALDLGESLIGGLRAFNSAQGSCVQKLMHMNSCAICAGEVHVLPCTGLCNSVLSNCLGPLADLEVPWMKYTDAVKLVTKMLMERQNLTFVMQFNRLPKRMITYFRQLLKLHQSWLQPQCAGTTKLLSLLEFGTEVEEIERDESKLSSTHKNLLIQLNELMQRMSRLWTDIAPSICKQPVYLLSESTSEKSCWNGTAKSTFNPSHCEFCGDRQVGPPVHFRDAQEQTHLGYPDTALGSTPVGVHQLGSPSRRQRTSVGLHGGPATVAFEQSLYPTAGEGGNGRFDANRHPIWAPWQSTEHEIAARQANEILVRAPRDLQWTADTLVGELQSYTAVTTRSQQSTEAAFEGHNRDENGAEGGYTDQSAAAAPSSATNPGNLSDSLGVLAYGSMLGWSLNDMQRGGGPNVYSHSQTRDYLERESLASVGEEREEETSTSAESNGDNLSSDLGSGYPPDPWRPADFPWRVDLHSPPGEADQISQVTVAPPGGPTISEGTVPQPEGSGSIPFSTNGQMPPYLDYADYPHLTNFHELWNLPRPVLVNSSSSTETLTSDALPPDQSPRPLWDDEDYAPVAPGQLPGDNSSKVTTESSSTSTVVAGSDLREVKPAKANLTATGGCSRLWNRSIQLILLPVIFSCVST